MNFQYKFMLKRTVLGQVFQYHISYKAQFLTIENVLYVTLKKIDVYTSQTTMGSS